jgi:cellulose synthase/poly-beta-1,6-N-acetylglucosamine synthase-like glycosyltransferase
MSTSPPRVSVIVPTHNRGEVLRENIESVLDQTYADYEVIYSDDASTDTTPEILNEYALACPDRMRSIRVEYGAPGPTRNAAARMARGKLLLFTDDDVCVPRDWVAGMVERFERGKCDALCGGIAPYSMESPVERYLHYRVLGALGNVPGIIRAAPMMNFLIRKSVFDRVGGFSNERLAAAEDWEFCRRLTAAGVRIHYDPSVCVDHRYQSHFGPAADRMRAAGEAGVTIWLKHHSGAGLYTAYSLFRCLASPCWIPLRYPLDLYALAIRMEFVFAMARLRAYWGHITDQ